MSNPNGCPFVHSPPAPNVAIRCPYCDHVTPPSEPSAFITLNAARAEARPAVDREAAWLIEWPANRQMPVRYWHPTEGHVLDANDAVRFCRREDAEAMLKRDHLFGGAKAVEYIWTALLSPATSPGEGSSGAESARTGTLPVLTETQRDLESLDPKRWEVTVRVDGEEMLTIGSHGYLCGYSDIDRFGDAVRAASRHLANFIGPEEASPCFYCLDDGGPCEVCGGGQPPSRDNAGGGG